MAATSTLNAGTGPDSLVLKISQDAYQGTPQYTVSVDGKQVGGTFTASASHAAKQSDTLTLKGDWAAGAHKVSVKFLNDAWGGTDGRRPQPLRRRRHLQRQGGGRRGAGGLRRLDAGRLLLHGRRRCGDARRRPRLSAGTGSGHPGAEALARTPTRATPSTPSASTASRSAAPSPPPPPHAAGADRHPDPQGRLGRRRPQGRGQVPQRQPRAAPRPPTATSTSMPPPTTARSWRRVAQTSSPAPPSPAASAFTEAASPSRSPSPSPARRDGQFREAFFDGFDGTALDRSKWTITYGGDGLYWNNAFRWDNSELSGLGRQRSTSA